MQTPDRHLPILLAALFVAAAPHFLRVPVWITLWCLGLWGFQLWLHRKNRRLPKKRERLLILGLGLAGTVATFGGGFGLRQGVGFLLVLLGVRPFEVSSLRDRVVTLFGAFFLVSFNLLASQSMATALAMIVSVLVTTTALIHINHPGALPRPKLRLAGTLFLQALPMTLILFVVFPRLPGGLLGFSDAGSTTGFSENLSMGDVSNLAQNPSPAFRVEFPQGLPEQRLLYFRGITLTAYSNNEWVPVTQEMADQGRLNVDMAAPSPLLGADQITYTLTMEPHHRKWVFALDIPLELPPEAPPGTEFLADRTVMLQNELGNSRRFTFTSATRYEFDATASGAFRARVLSLPLPPGSNPLARQLAREWRQQGLSDEDLVLQALDMFRTEEFYYTLEPPLLDPESAVDEFLFSTRRGFCEHFASSFAFLMRASGVPCRIVLGYQGGDVNPLGEYLIVRQSHAHAWNEVWLEGRGWVRVDPTAAVAPSRIVLGPQSALSEQDASLAAPLMSGNDWEFLSRIGFAWDAVNYYWSQWVLDYTSERQKSLFSELGFDSDSPMLWLHVVLAAMGVLALVGGIFFLRYWLWRPQPVLDPAQRAYSRFCAKLAKAGLVRPPHLGPRDFSLHIQEERPDVAPQAKEILDLYVAARYAGKDTDAVLEQLTRAVAGFQPKPLSASP
ncbi:MAG: DUF3488 domain-containing protein [Desulfovibrio sp.]|nr:MAG: DUF3488 domain-containing protein [Desulfovibrio sp.]